MPRYMFVAGVAPKGSKRLTVTAAKARLAKIEQAVIALDGRLETLDGAFGEAELYTICELPTNVAAASFASLLKSCQARPVRVIALPQPRRRLDTLPTFASPSSQTGQPSTAASASVGAFRSL